VVGKNQQEFVLPLSGACVIYAILAMQQKQEQGFFYLNLSDVHCFKKLHQNLKKMFNFLLSSELVKKGKMAAYPNKRIQTSVKITQPTKPKTMCAS